MKLRCIEGDPRGYVTEGKLYRVQTTPINDVDYLVNRSDGVKVYILKSRFEKAKKTRR